MAAGQMAKGLAKFVSWAGFVPLAAKDPVGVETATALAAKTMPEPAALLSKTSVSVIAIVLVLTAACFALREVRLAQRETHVRYLAPVLVVAASFAFIVFGWGFLQ
jgi:vacuolar-type H+-ATPase subunit B/Vma2